jgi:glycosyltransferase involved in cell wall biosynthesis
MKILMVNRYGYLGYGSENYFINLCELLRRKGHEVIVFTTKDARNVDKQYPDYLTDKLDFGNLKTVSLPKKILAVLGIIYSFADRKQIEKLIRDTNPDLVHIHNIKRLISPSILHSIKKFNLPIVCTLHDYYLVCPNYRLFSHGQLCEDCRGIDYHNVILKKCVRGSFVLSAVAYFEQSLHSLLRIFKNNVDMFIAPSDFLREKMIEHGFASEKLLTIPDFIFSEDYQPCYESDGYIAYFGRIVPEKGILTLVKAMRNLPSLKLVIIGDGDYKKDLESLVLKDGLHNIEFKGYLSQGEIKEVVKSAMFTVIPSQWYEVFGLVVLESFALGKPVIGAAIGALPELINSGTNGLLFKPADTEDLIEKIEYLLNNKAEVLRMGKNAREKVVGDFGADIHYEKIMQTYQSVISRRPCRK